MFVCQAWRPEAAPFGDDDTSQPHFTLWILTVANSDFGASMSHSNSTEHFALCPPRTNDTDSETTIGWTTRRSAMPTDRIPASVRSSE
jgi:hypothetical protein